MGESASCLFHFLEAPAVFGLWPLPPSSESAMLHCNPAPIVSLSPALTYLPASSSFCTEGPWDSTGPSLIT